MVALNTQTIAETHLMAFQCVFPREGLPTTPITNIWLLARVSLAMSLQVVMSTERKRAEVALKGSLPGCSILGGAGE
jgi:hypothetical protein